MKIIQIDGIKGLVTALGIGVCLFAGFVIFPGYVAQYLWNLYLVNLAMFPTINLFQGVLLWAMVAITYCILSKKGLAVSFKDTPELSDAELDSIIKTARMSAKMKMMNKVISKADTFEKHKSDVIKKSKSVDTETSLVSSPISISKKEQVNANEDEVVNK